jgi:hypothetical protein
MKKRGLRRMSYRVACPGLLADEVLDVQGRHATAGWLCRSHAAGCYD